MTSHHIIKSLRKQHNYTLEQVANILGIPVEKYLQVEAGEDELSIDKQQLLSSFYKLERIKFDDKVFTDVSNPTKSANITHHTNTLYKHTSFLQKEDERNIFLNTIKRLRKENEHLHEIIYGLASKI